MKSSPPGKKQSGVILRIKEVQINSVLNELNVVMRDYLSCLIQMREKSVKILQDMAEGELKSFRRWTFCVAPERNSIHLMLLMNDMEEKSMLREVENRRDNILKIESTILEVRNLFNELALIVDLQQEKVEEVEKQVDENLATVESGKKKIFSATKKRGKMRYVGKRFELYEPDD
ncbi:hypothetical protein RUM43_005654 [Polyplax serrata]|uniref:t-SNARE coiled-coil homology domain-containing protein n=1 Tax=Polyplax serrata TaxID=468196 RepID=A0AAN8NWE9_POLSC